MAEENEDSSASVAGGSDPAAVALALTGADRAEANAYLKDQRAFIAKQSHHLDEQFKQLRLSIWQQRLGVLLRIGTGFVGLIVAAGLTLMIWDASQSSGLLIEPFSVPPDLAARGMTGEVVAAKFLDRLSEMQAQTNSMRAAHTYINDWGQSGIKLEIPETGVSLNELDDFLRAKLGHDTHITGEIVHTASGVSLTARTGINGAETVTGSETDINGLVQQLSEKVYRATQPYRYGMYIASHDRLAEAIPIFKSLAQTGSKEERPWGYQLWGSLAQQLDSVDSDLRIEQQGMAEEPDNVMAQSYVANARIYKSQPEQAIRDEQKELSLLARNKLGMYSASFVPVYEIYHNSQIDNLLGNFRDAAQELTKFVQAGTPTAPTNSAKLAMTEASDHDLAAATATLSNTANYQVDYQPGLTTNWTIEARMKIDSETQDWADCLLEENAIAPMIQKYPGMRSIVPTTTVPLTAYAEAKLGKTADAEAHIAATPPPTVTTASSPAPESRNCKTNMAEPTTGLPAPLMGRNPSPLHIHTGDRLCWTVATPMEPSPSLPSLIRKARNSRIPWKCGARR